MTDSLMDEQRKAKERMRKRRGKQSRAKYLASVASKQPWKQYSLKENEYYARKRAGTLPELTGEGCSAVKLLKGKDEPTPMQIAESLKKGRGLSRKQDKQKRRAA